MEVDNKRVIAFLSEADKVLILTHKSPDGDTLGCGTALCRFFQDRGKLARVENSDPVPKKYEFLFEGVDSPEFVPEYIVAVDVADPKLLGEKLSVYKDKVDLCIDHHPSNLHYAKETLLCATDGAAALTLYRVFKEMGAEITPAIATCLYTGLSTDTGCFRYASTTAEAYRAGADLIDLGADNGDINIRMFETKPLSYFRILSEVMSGMRMYCNNQVSVLKVTRAMMERTGATDDALDAIAPMSRQIAGVKLGITMKQTKEGLYKFSLRTHEPLDASALAQLIGGGGHARAAGSGILEEEEAALRVVLEAAAKELHCEVE